jgi:phosphoserine aminotransferase
MSTVAPAPVHAVKTTSSGERVFNFSAGPGCLPDEVLHQIQSDVWNIFGTGIGILEHSHRGKAYDRVLAEAEADFRKIANVPANYKLLFLTGGATTQNFMVPLNLKSHNQTADYITTGYWAEKSLEHAKMYGAVNEAYSGKADSYAHIPDDNELKLSPDAAYVHICSNNTIYGTEWHAKNPDGTANYAAMMRVPKVAAGVPIVCDMSSDIYCRPVDFTKFGMVYAGAQKNLGVAGTTIVLIREDLLERKPTDKDGTLRPIPGMLQYKVHAKDESRHNTPPTGPIYISGQVFKWILRQGGLEAMAKLNTEKAGLIYKAIDDSGGFFKGHARKDSRSLMNITFRCPKPELDDMFVKEAEKHGMDGMKGHRATGGMRASTYNAMPLAGAQALAQFMREFARKNG